MITANWIYDVMIYIYALSLLFYFSDFVGTSRNSKRMGAGLLTFVWILQTAFFVFRMLEHRAVPILSLFDILFFFSWLLVTLSLVLGTFFRIHAVVFFVNVIGFVVLTLNLFSDPYVSPDLESWNMREGVLLIHILFAVVSYAAFSLSAVFSLVYLFLHRKLKEKRWTSSIRKFPSLEKIEYFAYFSAMSGVPLLILSVSLGLVWIGLKGEWKLMVDPKVLNSFLILGAYTYYLLQRVFKKAAGKRLAFWNLGAFATVVLNFAVSNFVSGFHQWFGI